MILLGANFVVATEDLDFPFQLIWKNLPPVHYAVSRSEIRLSEIQSMPDCWHWPLFMNEMKVNTANDEIQYYCSALG